MSSPQSHIPRVPDHKKKSERISINVDKATLEKIHAYCQKEEVSQSEGCRWLVQYALEHELRRLQKFD